MVQVLIGKVWQQRCGTVQGAGGDIHTAACPARLQGKRGPLLGLLGAQQADRSSGGGAAGAAACPSKRGFRFRAQAAGRPTSACSRNPAYFARAKLLRIKRYPS